MAVRAAILHRHRRARFGAEEHDRLAQDGARQRLAADLGIGRGDIPVIAQEHGGSPCCRYYPSARPRGRGRFSFLPSASGGGKTSAFVLAESASECGTTNATKETIESPPNKKGGGAPRSAPTGA